MAIASYRSGSRRSLRHTGEHQHCMPGSVQASLRLNQRLLSMSYGANTVPFLRLHQTSFESAAAASFLRRQRGYHSDEYGQNPAAQCD